MELFKIMLLMCVMIPKSNCESLNSINEKIRNIYKLDNLKNYVKYQIDTMNQNSNGKEVFDVAIITKFDDKNDELEIADELYKIIPERNPITKILIQHGFKEPSMLIYVMHSFNSRTFAKVSCEFYLFNENNSSSPT